MVWQEKTTDSQVRHIHSHRSKMASQDAMHEGALTRGHLGRLVSLVRQVAHVNVSCFYLEKNSEASTKRKRHVFLFLKRWRHSERLKKKNVNKWLNQVTSALLSCLSLSLSQLKCAFNVELKALFCRGVTAYRVSALRDGMQMLSLSCLSLNESGEGERRVKFFLFHKRGTRVILLHCIQAVDRPVVASLKRCMCCLWKH